MLEAYVLLIAVTGLVATVYELFEGSWEIWERLSGYGSAPGRMAIAALGIVVFSVIRELPVRFRELVERLRNNEFWVWDVAGAVCLNVLLILAAIYPSVPLLLAANFAFTTIYMGFLVSLAGLDNWITRRFNPDARQMTSEQFNAFTTGYLNRRLAH